MDEWMRGFLIYVMGKQLSIDQVQRLGGQAITKAFRSVSLPILEAEARIYPVEIHHGWPKREVEAIYFHSESCD